MGSNGLRPEDVVVLMVPFPLHGHLNQLLHLSRLISAHDVAVHYVSTAAHNRQARRRIHGWNPLSISNIFFHDQFPSLSFQSSFPSRLQPLFDASSALRQPVAELLRCLCAINRRVVIIYDSLMGSVVQDFVNFPNAESYTFHSVSAYTIFFFLWEKTGRPFAIDKEILENLPSLEGCFSPEFVKFVGNQHQYMNLNSGRIYNTCRVVESPFLELLAKPEISGNKKQWALGPFNPVGAELVERKKPSSNSDSRHRCLKWLDRQGPNSVILVSFGTTSTLPDTQIQKLATGLEKSKQKFVWVLRDADGGNFLGRKVKRVELPKGFEERVKKRGMIVRDWAPQLEILGHSATGGFMSHCGWNSCMESISMGVPIAAWPMHSDQPRNTVLITKVLKIGLAVKDWARRDELVKSSTVESAVERLMASEEGAEMRKRAAELSGSVRKAVAKGGATHLELDSFITHITR
ncbi:UNVERIFIED_CONTAM: Zeatin O-glucosyltransferase [Sesamum radiatum]|uniref:Glycosyltransferase n=1 Tax=Sesamum radiatum TaxID=300843 RepID=A0AAW2TKQ5_SESRA